MSAYRALCAVAGVNVPAPLQVETDAEIDHSAFLEPVHSYSYGEWLRSYVGWVFGKRDRDPVLALSTVFNVSVASVLWGAIEPFVARVKPRLVLSAWMVLAVNFNNDPVPMRIEPLLGIVCLVGCIVDRLRLVFVCLPCSKFRVSEPRGVQKRKNGASKRFDAPSAACATCIVSSAAVVPRTPATVMSPIWNAACASWQLPQVNPTRTASPRCCCSH